MIVTAKLKLLPTVEQHALLLQTMERRNEACNKVSAIAFHDHDWNQFRLHKRCYRGIRADFGLSAQMVVRDIKKVRDSYVTDVENLRIRNRMREKGTPPEELVQHKFKKQGAVAYDARCLSWKGRDKVSILTLGGRVVVSIVLSGKYADLDISTLRGECDLLYRKKEFYLSVSYEVPNEPPMVVADYIGCDLGRKNILSTSDGQLHCGDACEANRKKYVRLRQKFQRAGTKSAYKHLSKLDRREANFKADTNHCISKELVAEAKGTGRGIALEELTYIPRQVTAKKAFNDGSSKWAFHQLRFDIEYKAKLAGVPVVLVDPAYTSQRCSECGFVHEDNRRSQASFVCLSCGHAEHADHNASKNIRNKARAAVNRPLVVRHAAEAYEVGTASSSRKGGVVD